VTSLAHLLLADNGTVTWFKGWDLTGNYTTVDLIAASTNAPGESPETSSWDRFRPRSPTRRTSSSPVAGCVLLAVVGPTAGRWYIDLSSGVRPKQFIRGEWFVTIASFTGLVWILVFWATDNTWVALGVAFLAGYVSRVAALWYAWEEPLAKEPTGVYKHSDGRPMLGRKLAGKSQRELRDLGLLGADGETVVIGESKGEA
jgi:hypothetical protein